jgi:hypothetical protein
MPAIRFRPAVIAKVLLLCMLFSSHSRAQAPFAVPTFHCLGVYWSPAGGSADADVLVQYRRQGDAAWKDGLAMRYLPIAATTEDKADYRGSIVGLAPGTAYDIKLTLEGTATEETFTASTWGEEFPEGTVTNVGDGTATYAVTQSGTANAYRVFDGSGATIEVDESQEACITVEASYVILRGFTLIGGRNGIRLFDGCSDIVIEDCDISGWGRLRADPSVPDHGEDYNGAVFSNDEPLARVVIQRNRMHNPATASNSWVYGHPSGPQCIVFWNSQGNHVLRYNECYSDTGHYFNDIIGAGSNSGYTGFPGADCDIYGNYFANSWDDGVESEGGNQNVRVWNNYIENTLMAIANAATTIGPYYVWRNVSGASYSPPGSEWDMTHGNFMKMGYANGEVYMSGHMYLFHNTIYQVDDNGCDGLGGSSRIIKHCVTRNNILHVRSENSRSIAESSSSEDNDFDYDLCSKAFPSGHEQNGISGSPEYVGGAGFDASGRTGNFQLTPSSPGFDAGEVIPNFSDGYLGDGPDMGAHENGWQDFVYGVAAAASGTVRRSPDSRGLRPDCLHGAGSVEVYNLRGRRIHSSNRIEAGEAQADDRAAGIYLMRSGSEELLVRKWARY